MWSAKKIGVVSAAATLSSVALLLLFLLTFDWNHARPWLDSRVSQAIGRPFAIHGDLTLRWRQPDASAPEASSWRRWLPWPHLQARDIRIGNPATSASTTPMAEIKQLQFSLSPLPLFAKKIVIPQLLLDAPRVSLRRNRDGSNNWHFPNNPRSAWQLELNQLILNHGSVHLVDAIKRADLRAEISSITDSSVYGLQWQLNGSMNGQKINGSGKAGAVLSLQQQRTPFPIEATLEAGKTRISIKGTVTQPSALAALDLRLKLAGVSMAQLYPLTGILLPETSPYQTDGHLTGLVNRHGGNWRYENFRGKMGGSDIAGTLNYELKQPRPYLSGSVVSNVLHLKDLAPLIGADSNAKKAQRDASVAQPNNKALPTEQFKTERWRSIDTDVKFVGKKIIHIKELPIENLLTNFHMQDGVLSLLPLNFGVAGGQLASQIKLDGRTPRIKAEMKIRARQLKLKQLFPTFQPMQASLGEINGDALLTAQGNSIATLLGSSNGEVKALVNDGTISKLLLEEIGLNIGNIVLSKVFGDKQVQLHCMASDFTVTNGLMQTRSFVIDTDESLMNITGQINLAQEELNLTLKSKAKGLRLISLRAPLYVTGSFKQPKVSVDKGIMALKVGSAIGLAALAPIAALLPLANIGSDRDSECAALLTSARRKPTAPAPGKSYRTGKAKL